MKTSIYYFLAKRAMDDNDYESAYHYYKNFAEMDIEMLEECLQQNVLEIQKKYDYEKVQNEYNVKLLRKHRLLMSSLFVTLICFTVRLYASHQGIFYQLLLTIHPRTKYHTFIFPFIKTKVEHFDKYLPKVLQLTKNLL